MKPKTAGELRVAVDLGKPDGDKSVEIVYWIGLDGKLNVYSWKESEPASGSLQPKGGA